MKYLENWLNGLAGYLVLVMSLLVTADVAGRYMFRSPIQGALEVTEFIMVGIVFLALSYCMKQKAQISMSTLVDHTRGATRSILNLLGLFAGLIFIGLIVWAGGREAIEAWRGGYTTFGFMPLPVTPAKMAIPVGGLLAWFRVLLDFIIQIKNFGKEGPNVASASPSEGGT